jgi:hypothetical protein
MLASGNTFRPWYEPSMDEKSSTGLKKYINIWELGKTGIAPFL